MKNTKFIIWWILTSALLLPVFLTGCKSFLPDSTEKEITVKLPDWPPDDSFTSNYPQLSRWKITLANADNTTSFFTTSKTLSLTVDKNQPFCILAQPLTFLDQNLYPEKSESDYFKPAGFLYPYMEKVENTQNQTSNQITWEQGFLAYQMIKIISGKIETGVSESHTNSFLSSFNWKKAQETIENKISASQLQEQTEVSKETTAVFNPWLIDSYKLLDNLCYGNFKSSFLNITGTYTYELNKLFPNGELSVLSSFIPENKTLAQNPHILLQKNSDNFLSNAKNKAVIINCYSAKKVSLVFIFMPIFIEDI